MHLLRIVITLLLGIILCTSSYSQNDSCNLRISLLTCGPGEDLYSIWGHSAIRVKDESLNTDIIFNYGTFDFEDPDFYVKFVKGKLLYFSSVEKFSDFYLSYKMENRSIIEQVLILDCGEKQKLYDSLKFYTHEENKYYLYQFFFDNCSSRLRDIVAANTKDKVHFKNILPEPQPTFRDMIHVDLNRSGMHWSKFGIDLLLASRIDRKVKNEEAMFLPVYLMKGFDSAVIRNRPLVDSKQLILPSDQSAVADQGTVFKPLAVTVLFLLAGLLLTFGLKERFQKIRNAFDATYFFILGFIGCFILFMWFGTDHELCRDNYNVIWALPSHVVMAFLVRKKTDLVRKYFLFTAVLAFAFLLAWPILPQGMNLAFLPLVVLAGIRSAHIARKK
jgi:hypothetical protein